MRHQQVRKQPQHTESAEQYAEYLEEQYRESVHDITDRVSQDAANTAAEIMEVIADD